MINHVRTLILNRDGSRRPGYTFYLEELVDPSFVGLKLTGNMADAHAALIERNADTAFENFRVRQYTQILHSTEFEKYVTELDPRITYLNRKKEVQKAYVRATPVNDEAGDTPLIFSGRISTTNARLINNWTITAESPTLVKALHQQSNTSHLTTVEFSGGTSTPFLMTSQHNYYGRVRAASMEEDAKWQVEAFSEPNDDLSDVLLKTQNLPPEVLADIFPDKQPFKLFRDLWEKNALISYKLSGFLLAFAYRAEELRTNG